MSTGTEGRTRRDAAERESERQRRKRERTDRTRGGDGTGGNADDITFRKDLPPGHDLSDPAEKERIKAAEGLESTDSAPPPAEVPGAASAGSLSYEDWLDTIRSAAEGDAAYQAAAAARTGAEDARPTYAGTWESDLREAYGGIADREDFRYDLDDDALYRQYADRYMAAGKLAMRDSMGQAASLTGGYGSSYGQAAGQQSYDAYLQGLGDIALEMYDRAYGRYQDEGDALRERYELAAGRAEDEYGRYRDALAQWNTDRAFAADAADTALDRAYRLEGEAYDRAAREEETAYARQADYAAVLASYGDFSGYAEIFGEERAAAMQAVWNAGNFDLAYNSGKITAEEYRAMTGKWPKGYKKGGGSGGGGGKKDGGSRYDAVLAEVRLIEGSGGSADAIQSRIDSAYDSGAITKPQHDWLTDNFGSGSKSGGTGRSGPGGGSGLA